MKTNKEILDDIKKQLLQINQEKKELGAKKIVINKDIENKTIEINTYLDQVKEVNHDKRVGTILTLGLDLYTAIIGFCFVDKFAYQVLFSAILYTGVNIINITLVREMINRKYEEANNISIDEYKAKIEELRKGIDLNREQIDRIESRLIDINYTIEKYINIISPCLTETEKKEFSLIYGVKEEKGYSRILHR